MSDAWNPFEKQHKRIGIKLSLQRCTTRLVCSDYSRFSSVTSMQQSLGWDTLEVLQHLSAATMMFETVQNHTHLTFPASVLVHSGNRSNHSHKFRHIFARTNACMFSFFPRVIPLWNSLPMSAESVTAFQTNALPTIRQYCKAM